jgi:hypothetical protein
MSQRGEGWIENKKFTHIHNHKHEKYLATVMTKKGIEMSLFFPKN